VAIIPLGMASKPKVLIHGAGAIGIAYVYMLDKAGCEVTAVCRSNYEAAKGKTLLHFFWRRYMDPSCLSNTRTSCSLRCLSYILRG